VFRLSVVVEFVLYLAASVAFDSPTEVVVLALGAYPSSVREIESRILTVRGAFTIRRGR